MTNQDYTLPPEITQIENGALTGADTLRWLADHGAKFVRVCGHTPHTHKNREGKDEPCPSLGKRAVDPNWHLRPHKLSAALGWLNIGRNVGMLCGDHSGGLALLDLDQAAPEFLSYYHYLANAPRFDRDNDPDRTKILVRLTEPTAGKKYYRNGNSWFELLANGQQGVIAGIHESGAELRLVNPGSDIPTLDPGRLRGIIAFWCDESEEEPAKRQNTTKVTQDSATRAEDARAALDALDPWRADNYQTWIAAGMALSGMGAEGLTLWETWSQKSPKYKPGECARRWQTFKPQRITPASLFFWADEDAPGWRAVLRSNSNGHKPALVLDPEPPAPFEGGELQPEPPARHLPADLYDAPGLVPDLPDFAKLAPETGRGAGAWIDLYTDYARSVSPMTPTSFHESAALWLASVAVARRLVLNMPYDAVYPNLFILWVAQTTLYRKTTALNVARTIARQTFPQLLAPQDTTPEAFLSDFSGQQPGNYATMTPGEQEAWNLERNFSAQRGLVVDEMSGMIAGMGKDYNAGLLEALLRFYDCDPLYSRSTRAQGRIVVKNAYLAMLGASTPAALAAHMTAERLWGVGWWPRFAILTPETNRPDWQEATDREPPAALAGQLLNLYNRLPVAKWPEAPQAQTVTLGVGVLDAWNRYNKALSFDLLTPELPGQLFGAYGRLPTTALKVSILLAALDWPTGQALRVELPHLARALEITEAWRASVHRALEGAASTAFDSVSKRILRQVAKYEPTGATLREVHRQMQDKGVAELEMAISDLVRVGLLEELDPEKGKKGRPSKRYRLVSE